MNMSNFIAAISGKALKALVAGAASIVATAAVDKLLAKNDDADPVNEMKPEKSDVEATDDEVQTVETTKEVNED